MPSRTLIPCCFCQEENVSDGDERAAKMNQMSMIHSFHADAFFSFACSPEEKIKKKNIVAVVVDILLCFPVGYATRWREWGSGIA